MKTSILPHCSLMALALVACGDPQVTPQYSGQSLLKIQGSIKSSEPGQLEAGVVPAVLWYRGASVSSDFEQLDVQETDVQGDFPSQFRLDLYVPPPKRAHDYPLWTQARGFEDEPNILVGYIGALPEEHDEQVWLGSESKDDKCEKDDAGQPIRCVETYCDHYQQCWEEHSELKGMEWTVVKRTGATGVRNGLGILTGFVDGYFVVYLDRPAKAGSLAAFRFGASELAAGFHLIRIVPDDEAIADSADCGDTLDETDRRFEAAYGVRIEDLDEDDPRIRAWLLFGEQVAMESGCVEPGFAMKLVEPGELVTMILGTDLAALEF